MTTSGAQRAQLFEAPDDLDEIIALYHERRWSDGLPIVPPTEARVARLLAGTRRGAQEVVATIAPNFGAATVERIAVNAVMAGCKAEHMPVLIAAVEAACAPEFNLQGVQATTNPVAVWLIVNGPIAERIGVASGMGCLGQGYPANLALGRALRLVLQNIGGARPGDMDRATQGQPGKVSFCCAENEAESPWQPLHVERGLAPGSSAVTVVGAAGTLNLNTHAKDANDTLRVIADSFAFPPSNDYWIAGEPWLILAPEHAHILHREGLDKAEVKRRLWDLSRMRAGRMARKDLERTRIARGKELGEIGEDTLLPVCARADEIGLVVAGGPGTHSVYVPSFGDTRAVTRAIAE